MSEKVVRIPLVEVESSLFSHIGYDDKRRILSLRFKSGVVFNHGSVPPDLADDFREALSLGYFYNQHIKGKFPGEKMTGDCPKCGDYGWIGDRCLDCGCADYAAPIRHALCADHPSSSSKRSNMADCGRYFQPKEFARSAEGVTCPECLKVREDQDGMSF